MIPFDVVQQSGMLSSVPGLPEKWTTSQRIQWTTSTGMGGQLRMDWVDNINRRTQSEYANQEIGMQLALELELQIDKLTFNYI
jgi:hypothetical protein